MDHGDRIYGASDGVSQCCPVVDKEATSYTNSSTGHLDDTVSQTLVTCSATSCKLTM